MTKKRWLIVIFVLSFAFDVKGAKGGSFVQFAMAALNVATFLLLAVRFRGLLPRRGASAGILIVWCALLIVGSLGSAIYSVPFSQYMRTIFPFFLFAEGFMVAWWAGRRYDDAAVLVYAMSSAAVISLFFTLWWGFYFTGNAATSIRYQILSPLIPYLVIVAAFDLMFLRRRRLVSIALLAITLGVIGLSITRSMLLVIFLVLVAVFAAVILKWLAGRLLVPKPVLRTILGGTGISGLALVGALFAAPDVIDRWINRALGPHHNVTFWTRVAAVVQQWEQVVSRPTAWFFGRGFGQNYHYATSFASMLIPYVPSDRFHMSVWFPAEFMWIAPVYYAGLIVGPMVICALLWGGVIAFRSLLSLTGQNAWADIVRRPYWLGALGYFAFLGTGFTSDPFIVRLAAMFMGLTLGLTVTTPRSPSGGEDCSASESPIL